MLSLRTTTILLGSTAALCACSEFSTTGPISSAPDVGVEDAGQDVLIVIMPGMPDATIDQGVDAGTRDAVSDATGELAPDAAGSGKDVDNDTKSSAQDAMVEAGGPVDAQIDANGDQGAPEAGPTCSGATPNACGAVCTDVQSDGSNCGHCGTVCSGGQACSAGACKCPTSTPDFCAGTCTNTQTDSANCGACGPSHSCSGGRQCSMGACTCPSGTLLCGGSCAPCGDLPPNSAPTCNGQACTYICDTGTVACSSGCCTVQRLAAGNQFGCGITPTGGVKCWGSGLYGELGNGGTTGSTVPTPVTGLSAGVVAVSAGAQSACALTSGGAVECWGYGGAGNLGNGNTAHSYVPVPVTGLSSGAVAISAGGAQSCAVTSQGSLLCWGQNEYGEVGDGTLALRDTPVPVMGLGSGVKAVATGYSVTCALTDVGAVWCWGDNTYGALGNGSSATYSAVPVAVSGLSSGVRSLSVGDEAVCALTSSGVMCWGDNVDGDLGNGTSASQSTTPVPAFAASNLIGLGLGSFWNTQCAWAGSVWCWGTNYGSAPTAIPGLTNVQTIVVGAPQGPFCALVNEAPYCWGQNDQGELGNGTMTGSSTPVPVSWP
jgi:alpha-tubulin suppressor-like RCC1 family protein